MAEVCFPADTDMGFKLTVQDPVLNFCNLCALIPL